MKLEMSSANRTIVAMLVAVALGAAFWMLALSPKREEAKELSSQASALQASLAQHEAEVAQAEEARHDFPAEYQRLVVLGKAVPGDDDIASLLVQLNHIAGKAGGTFRDVKLSSSGGGEEATAGPADGSVSPTEVAASLLPIGATIGPAGLGVMPYAITFDGKFFQVADFLSGLDSLVETQNEDVLVDGRLVTIDGFSLAADQAKGFPHLRGTFSVTTFLTPPGQGLTAGATEAAPATATPAATTIGATP